MAKIPVKKMNDGTTNYFPVSVLDSVFLNKEIQVKNTIGGITKGTTFAINTSLHTIINKLLGEQGADLDELLSLKVDKVAGKDLSSNDFTDAYKAALDGLDSQLASKVDSESGKRLMTDAEGTKLADLENYDDTEIRNDLEAKVNIETGKRLMTDEEGTKIAGLDTALEAKVDKEEDSRLLTNDEADVINSVSSENISSTVVSAIENMDEDQIAAVKAALGIS